VVPHSGRGRPQEMVRAEDKKEGRGF